jgi:hypothetical protein
VRHYLLDQWQRDIDFFSPPHSSVAEEQERLDKYTSPDATSFDQKSVG